jgi:thimet oligopeptidase
MRCCRATGSALLLAFCLTPWPSSRAAEPVADPLHAFSVGDDPERLEAWTERHLTQAQQDIDAVLSVKGARTVANTFRPLDDANAELTIAGSQTYQVFAVHPDAAMRDQGQALSQRVSSASTALSLNHDVYEALSAISTDNLDPATRHLIERSLLEYRLAGVDRDGPTRARVQELQDRISETSLLFHRNVADDVRKLRVTRAELDGLPADFIARHAPDAQGNYVITTDEPDVGPVETYATNAELRHRLFLAYTERAYPANKAVLEDLLKERYELATLLGYRSFADLDLADQMIGSSAHLEGFLEEVDAATRDPARHEYRRLLKFAETREPNLKAISEADRPYWTEQYRRAVYGSDAEAVRPYFPFSEVEAGVMRTAARLFHIEFHPVTIAHLWDPSVSAFDVLDHGKKIGRIYLDLHPRDGKDKGFSSAPLVPGIKGRQIPEGLLICNFPGGQAGDPGLMQYHEVVVFFHEFGHLMHHILGGQGPYAAGEVFNLERDFFEAPSQMLEEFFHDPRVLESFARRLDTQEPIPAELVTKMNIAAAFGRGMVSRRQLLYANYAFQIHDGDPVHIDFDQLLKSDAARFQATEQIEGNRMYASFTHLSDYGAKYYTYAFDKVIALDFFARFDKDDLLDGPEAMRYRRTVLDPGSTRSAEQLVRDFLGRPENLDAFKEWLNVEFQAAPPGAPAGVEPARPVRRAGPSSQ